MEAREQCLLRVDSAAPEACTACDSRHKRLLKRSEKCTIKGNINAKGERIYHMPGQQAYGVTRINPDAGERWFCSEAEAKAAGWRKALR